MGLDLEFLVHCAFGTLQVRGRALYVRASERTLRQAEHRRVRVRQVRREGVRRALLLLATCARRMQLSEHLTRLTAYGLRLIAP